jgi:hypothetical protein
MFSTTTRRSNIWEIRTWHAIEYVCRYSWSKCDKRECTSVWCTLHWHTAVSFVCVLWGLCYLWCIDKFIHKIRQTNTVNCTSLMTITRGHVIRGNMQRLVMISMCDVNVCIFLFYYKEQLKFMFWLEKGE